jgi:hypothetical protein
MPLASERWSALFTTLFHDMDLDVVAMQEVTPKSWELLLEMEQIRKNWIVVDCKYLSEFTFSDPLPLRLANLLYRSM